MDARISQLTAQPSVAKTTATEPFGKVLSRAVGSAAGVIGNTVGGAVGGIPILSAALSSASRIGQTIGSIGAPGAPSSPGLTGVAGTGGSSGSGSTGNDLLEAQRALQEQGQSFNMQYLHLQDAMQKESQEFSAISNIMKVRSDSAKAAINNIR